MDIKQLLIVIVLGALIVAYAKEREKIGQELVIAFLIALFWTSFFYYEYTSGNVFLFEKINLYPLVLWTGGLVLLREVYEQLHRHKFLYTLVLYWAVLFFLELIGYHFLNIRMNGDYPSLFNSGVIHAPIAVKTFYIFAGPLYLLITNYLRVK